MPLIKAISVHQPYASLIAGGIKRAEVRSRRTHYRGDLLIVSTRDPVIRGLPLGVGLAIVELYDCRPFTRADATDACIRWAPDLFVWLLRNVRPLHTPLPIRGQQMMYTVNLP
jgi:hypothetical protein